LHDVTAPASGLRYLPLALGFFFAFIGNILPKFRQNSVCGIRTPWTMKSEEVWFKTHRLGGRLWVVGGLFMALAVFLVPDKSYMVLMFSVITILVLLPVFYSYILYRRIAAGHKNSL